MAKVKASRMGGGKGEGKVIHKCPTCNSEAKPVMLMPGRKIYFKCENSHEIVKGQTVKS